jgi:NAD(P)-dependent dehydrogenase (short-subunit alcohol dehydrogenase family)
MRSFKSGVLAGKTAFVAGGSSGINFGIAQGLAEAGARISLISRNQEKVDAAVAKLHSAGYQAMGAAADVRDYAAVEVALRSTRIAYGEIDIVVSGAAGNFLASAVGMSPNAFRAVVDIDLIGTYHVLRASYEHLRKPGASVISITAGQAINATLGQSHACAAKAGVNMLTRCLALEWGASGVRVNAISPGPIRDTEGMSRLTPTPESVAAFRRTIPLGDYGEKRDIADLAIYLSSDSACYITGAIMDCDGGSSLSRGSVVHEAPLPV